MSDKGNFKIDPGPWVLLAMLLACSHVTTAGPRGDWTTRAGNSRDTTTPAFRALPDNREAGVPVAASAAAGAPVAGDDITAALDAGNIHAAWRALAQRLENAPDDARNDPALLLQAGIAQTRLHHPYRATAYLEAAEALFRSRDDTAGAATATGYLAINESERVHPDDAMAHFDEAIRALPDAPRLRGLFLIEQGRLYLRIRNVPLAIQRFEKALEIAEEAAIPLLEAQATLHLGMAALDSRHAAEAVQKMTSAAGLYASQQQPRLEAAAREQLVFPLLAQGRYDEAVDQAEKAIALLPAPWEAPNDALISPDLGAYPTLWRVYEWKGDYLKALASQEGLLSKVREAMRARMPAPEPSPEASQPISEAVEAVAVSVEGDESVQEEGGAADMVAVEPEAEEDEGEEIGMEAVVEPAPPPEPPHHVVEAAIYESRGALLHELGQVTKAMDAYAEALSIYADAGLAEDQVRVYGKAIRLLRSSGALARLDALMTDAEAAAQRLTDPTLIGDLLRFTGPGMAALGDPDAALAQLDRSMAAYDEAGNLTKKGLSLLAKARVLDHVGDHDAATEALVSAASIFAGAHDVDWYKKTTDMLHTRYQVLGAPIKAFARKFQSFTLPNAQIWAPVMHAPLGKYPNTTRLFRYLGTYDVFGAQDNPARPVAFPFSLRDLPFYSMEAFAGAVQEYSEQQLALRSATSLGDKMSTAESLAAKAFYYDDFLLVGFTGDALNSAVTTLDAFAKAGYTRLTSVVLSMMSEIYIEPGLFDAGLRFLEKKVVLDREQGDIAGAASAIQQALFYYLDQEKPRQAFALAEKGIAMARDHGNLRLEAMLTARKAEAQLQLDLPAKALVTGKQALDLAKTSRCPVTTLVALSIIAQAQDRTGDTAGMKQLGDEAASMSIAPVAVYRNTLALLLVGDAYRHLGRDDEARAFYATALKLLDKKQDIQLHRAAKERLAE